MIKCENCNLIHDGKYASGRFCSSKCARGFSTKSKRSEINQKVSEKLKGITSKLSKKQILDNIKKANSKFSDNCLIRYKSKSFDELSIPQKRRRVIEEQENKCLLCNISEW